MSRDALARRLLATFLDELEEGVASLNADILALETAPEAAEPLRSLFRTAHTLKGASHAAGVPVVEETCHAVEVLLAGAREGTRILGPREIALLLSFADAMSDAGDRLRAGGSLDDSPLALVRGRLRSGGPGDRPRPGAAEAAPAEHAARALPEPSRGPAAAVPAAGATQVRVEPEKLDALMAAAGELYTATGRVRRRAAELQELRELASALSDHGARTVRRLERGAGPTAPAGLHGLLDEMRDLAGLAERIATGAAEDARAVAGTAGRIGQHVRLLRMRPFSDLAETLPRVARDNAARLGKEVRLETAGAAVQADREIWRAVREALSHLIRNAVDHGIEPPEVRSARGKPPVGRVAVRAAVRGDRIVVTIADDGAGVDGAAVAAELEARGLPVPSDERQLAEALLSAALTTRAEPTLVSGRGVGLDSARAALRRIRGTLDVAWTAGRGTTFTIECPPSPFTMRVVLVRVGEALLAIPTTDVGRLLYATPAEIRRVDGRETLPIGDGPVPLLSLANLLGATGDPEPPDRRPLLLLRSGARRVAVSVDEWISEEELLVRPLHGIRRPPRVVSGAALLASGEIALVVSSVALLDAAREAPDSTVVERGPAAPRARLRRILVVDDSITSRTLEQGLLEAAGFDVVTAVDGAEGWRILQAEPCDLVISDVEMPRMDGFELCRAIRASKRLGGLPVILVTALESSEHRARGLEVGADAYVAKSSFDQERLLETIRQLLG